MFKNPLIVLGCGLSIGRSYTYQEKVHPLTIRVSPEKIILITKNVSWRTRMNIDRRIMPTPPASHFNTIIAQRQMGDKVVCASRVYSKCVI